jgi:hypothetical protein
MSEMSRTGFTPEDKLFFSTIRSDVLTRPDFYRAGREYLNRRWSPEVIHAAELADRRRYENLDHKGASFLAIVHLGISSGPEHDDRRIIYDYHIRPLFAEISDSSPERMQEVAGWLDRCARLTLDPAPPAASTRTQFRPFPTDLLPESVSRFVTATAASKLVDESMVALPALAILGAAIGTTRRILAKDDWAEYPIIWTAVIAASGERKTPTFAAVGAPLKAMQLEADEAYQEAKHSYDRRVKERMQAQNTGSAETEPGAWPSPPKYNHVLTTDTTVEAVGKMLSTSSRGMLVFKDELSDFVGSMNAYKKGGNDLARGRSRGAHLPGLYRRLALGQRASPGIERRL